MKNQIILDEFGERHGPYALGVTAGEFVFTNQIGTDKEGKVVPGGIKAQTKRLFWNRRGLI